MFPFYGPGFFFGPEGFGFPGGRVHGWGRGGVDDQMIVSMPYGVVQSLREAAKKGEDERAAAANEIAFYRREFLVAQSWKFAGLVMGELVKTEEYCDLDLDLINSEGRGMVDIVCGGAFKGVVFSVDAWVSDFGVSDKVPVVHVRVRTQFPCCAVAFRGNTVGGDYSGAVGGDWFGAGVADVVGRVVDFHGVWGKHLMVVEEWRVKQEEWRVKQEEARRKRKEERKAAQGGVGSDGVDKGRRVSKK